jgi:hypothetical protein
MWLFYRIRKTVSLFVSCMIFISVQGCEKSSKNTGMEKSINDLLQSDGFNCLSSGVASDDYVNAIQWLRKNKRPAKYLQKAYVASSVTTEDIRVVGKAAEFVVQGAKQRRSGLPEYLSIWQFDITFDSVTMDSIDFLGIAYSCLITSKQLASDGKSSSALCMLKALLAMGVQLEAIRDETLTFHVSGLACQEYALNAIHDLATQNRNNSLAEACTKMISDVQGKRKLLNKR